MGVTIQFFLYFFFCDKRSFCLVAAPLATLLPLVTGPLKKNFFAAPLCQASVPFSILHGSQWSYTQLSGRNRSVRYVILIRIVSVHKKEFSILLLQGYLAPVFAKVSGGTSAPSYLYSHDIKAPKLLTTVRDKTTLERTICPLRSRFFY